MAGTIHGVTPPSAPRGGVSWSLKSRNKGTKRLADVRRPPYTNYSY